PFEKHVLDNCLQVLLHQVSRNPVVSVCVVYQLVSLSARSWVKEGVVGPIPGVWWVDGVVLLLLVSVRGRRLRRRS
ncbi:MAG: hypothetical protein HRU14_03315, partial [Planctomycetes bacterium]|nr:hypothetical protein [Planctomycetota bacterium]